MIFGIFDKVADSVENVIDVNKAIEGIYYAEYEIGSDKVFGLIEIKEGKFIKSHGLYYDIKREKVYREPYQPDILSYEIIGKTLIITDPSNSYEVEKLSFFGEKIIIRNPRYKIEIDGKNIILTNLDINLVYRKIVE